jgi:hypothetical protein
MSEPKAQIRRLRRLGQHRFIDRDRLVVAAEAHGRCRRQGAIVEIGGVERQESLQLLAGGGVAVAIHQAARIFQARRAMVGLQLEHGGQEQLGIVQHAARHADFGQQPHRLGVIPMAQEEGADPPFGWIQVPVGEQGRAGHHLAWKGRQGGDMGRRGRRIGRVADQPIEAFEHLPGHGQGRIDVHRPQQGVDGCRGIAPRDEAKSALLVEKAEPGLKGLQPRQALHGLVDTQQVAQAGGLDEQQITIPGPIDQHRPGHRQGVPVPSLALEAAEAEDLGFHRRDVGHDGGPIHERSIARRWRAQSTRDAHAASWPRGLKRA